jgi:hypothetical protein
LADTIVLKAEPEAISPSAVTAVIKTFFLFIKHDKNTSRIFIKNTSRETLTSL